MVGSVSAGLPGSALLFFLASVFGAEGFLGHSSAAGVGADSLFVPRHDRQCSAW